MNEQADKDMDGVWTHLAESDPEICIPPKSWEEAVQKASWWNVFPEDTKGGKHISEAVLRLGNQVTLTGGSSFFHMVS